MHNGSMFVSLYAFLHKTFDHNFVNSQQKGHKTLEWWHM